MKSKLFSLLALTLVPAALLAQDDKNLVKNPGFEETSGKLKGGKQILKAKGWKSNTIEVADLYSSSTKDPLCATKDNPNGGEDPAEGNNYAGIVAFSFGDKNPRTYITTELLGPLKEGVQYCVSFKLSLADQSKYSCNNIGAHLSKKEVVSDKKENIILETHARHPKNKVISQSYGWEQVCNVFTAKGGEKYITIGNFSATKETKSEKVPKPKGTTKQQLPSQAYYFVDEIKVFQLDSIQECQCDVPKEEKAKVNYSEEFGSNKDFTPEEKVAQNKVYFDQMSTILKNDAVDHLNKIIEVLNANPDLKVEVIAHCDKSEYAKIEVDDRAKDLTANRAQAIIDFLVKGGISSSRLSKVIKEDQEPVSTEMTELGMAKNRRVEFKASK